LPVITKVIDEKIKKIEKAEKNSILPYENDTLKRLKEAKRDE